MGSIRIDSVTKQFGPHVVLRDISLELHTGEIVALVGANGTGKTTLFRLIDGQFKPDLGTITVSRGLEIGYLPQEPDIAEAATLREAVGEAFVNLLGLESKLHELSDRISTTTPGPQLDELMQQYDRLSARFEIAGGYTFETRLNEVLGGLGFSQRDYELPVSALSGGQKCRAALAKLLLQDRQYLLLDEPTNHLDIDAVRWLEKFLAGHHGGAAIVSHDRYLLDRLAQRTLDLEITTAGGRIHSYPGNYSKFVAAREVRRKTQLRQYEIDKEFIERERTFIERNMAAQKGKQAKGRLKRLERMLADGEFVLERPVEQRTARIEFREVERVTQEGKELIRLDGVSKRYGDKVLFTELDLALYAGQRLGITGPNGTGKTTLLRMILGRVPADTGQVHVSASSRIGYFAQESSELDPTHTIIDEILALRPHLLERDARHVAARFHFVDQEPFKKLGQLSGGEQSRVRFMRLILEAPDVLILDEPTNHLDIFARETLEASLADFPGTIIAVSHDRYFLDRIAERLLVMRQDGVRMFHGNYSYYIEQIERERAELEAARRAAEPQCRKSGGRSRAAASGTGPACPFARYKLADLEAYITEREEQLADLEQSFADPAVYRDAEQIMRLRAHHDQLRSELTAAEAAWLRRAEQS